MRSYISGLTSATAFRCWLWLAVVGSVMLFFVDLLLVAYFPYNAFRHFKMLFMASTLPMYMSILGYAGLNLTAWAHDTKPRTLINRSSVALLRFSTALVCANIIVLWHLH